MTKQSKKLMQISIALLLCLALIVTSIILPNNVNKARAETIQQITLDNLVIRLDEVITGEKFPQASVLHSYADKCTWSETKYYEEIGSGVYEETADMLPVSGKRYKAEFTISLTDPGYRFNVKQNLNKYWTLSDYKLEGDNLSIGTEITLHQIVTVQDTRSKQIDTIDVQAVNPVIGDYISEYTATVDANADYVCLATTVKVFQDEIFTEVSPDSKFAKDKKYLIRVDLEAKSGARFIADFTADQKWSMVAENFNANMLSLVWQTTPVEEITNIDFTMEDLEIGKPLVDNIEIDTNKFYISNIYYHSVDEMGMTTAIKSKDTLVEGGKKYQISFNILSRDGYAYADNVTIPKGWTKVYADAECLQVKKIVNFSSMSGLIESVNISLDYVAGKPFQGAKVDSDQYSVSSVTVSRVSEIENSVASTEALEAGVSYVAVVSLVTANNYTFSQAVMCSGGRTLFVTDNIARFAISFTPNHVTVNNEATAPDLSEFSYTISEGNNIVSISQCNTSSSKLIIPKVVKVYVGDEVVCESATVIVDATPEFFPESVRSKLTSIEINAKLKGSLCNFVNNMPMLRTFKLMGDCTELDTAKPETIYDVFDKNDQLLNVEISASYPAGITLHFGLDLDDFPVRLVDKQIGCAGETSYNVTTKGQALNLERKTLVKYMYKKADGSAKEAIFYANFRDKAPTKFTTEQLADYDGFVYSDYVTVVNKNHKEIQAISKDEQWIYVPNDTLVATAVLTAEPNVSPSNYTTNVIELLGKDVIVFVKDKYTVSFELCGHGIGIAPLWGVQKGNYIAEPKAPIDDVCVFKGWYKDKTFEQPWDFLSDTVTKNTILYAKWVIIAPEDPTVTVTPTPTVTITVTPTPTVTVTVTPSPTVTATVTPSPTVTATVTPSPTVTVTVTPTPSPTVTVTVTPTPSTNTPSHTTPNPPTSAPTSTPSYTTPTPGIKPTVTPTIKPTVTPTIKPTVEATVKGNTSIVKKISKDELKKLINTSDNKDSVVINLNDNKDVTVATIPLETLSNIRTIVNSDKKVKNLTITLPKGEVSLDAKVLDAVRKQAASSNIALKVNETKVNSLSDTQQKTLETYEVAKVLDLAITSNKKEIHNFNGGIATVSVEFTPEKGKKANNYTVCYVSEKGEKQFLPTSYTNGKLKFSTSHFSTYAIVYNVKSTSAKKNEILTNVFVAKGVAGKNTIKLAFSKVANADYYTIYGADMHTDSNLVKLASTKKNIYTVKDLHEDTPYIFFVKAYKKVNGKRKLLAKSPEIELVTENKATTNIKKVTVSKREINLVAGALYKVKPELIKVNNKKDEFDNQIIYLTSNSDVAKVTTTGNVIAKKSGVCYIYALAKNSGAYAKIKVTVTDK